MGSESGSVEGALPPSMQPLKPVDPETSSDDVVSVTYWLRLLLTASPKAGEKEGKSHWATHPIILLPGTDYSSGSV